MLIFLWIQIYLSKQRGLTTNGWEADGQIRTNQSKRVIAFPGWAKNINTHSRYWSCLYVFIFHPVNLICFYSWILYQAVTGDLPKNSCLVEVVYWKYYCNFRLFSLNPRRDEGDPFKGGRHGNGCILDFLINRTLMGPQGPLLFFHRTKAQRLLYWFLSISQRKIIWQKRTIDMTKKQDINAFHLFKKKKKIKSNRHFYQLSFTEVPFYAFISYQQ